MSQWQGSHRAFAVEAYFKAGESLLKARQQFCSHFKIRRVSDGPSTQLISAWVQKFRKTGSTLNIHPPGPSTSVATPENISTMREEIRKNPRKSVRKVAASTGLKKTTVHKILKYQLNFHPYKLQIVQQLKEGDCLARERVFADMRYRLDECLRQNGSHLEGVCLKNNVRIIKL
ncbi:hypothetical protein ACJJTC_013533 [Scirpophaga incertulas]